MPISESPFPLSEPSLSSTFGIDGENAAHLPPFATRFILNASRRENFARIFHHDERFLVSSTCNLAEIELTSCALPRCNYGEAEPRRTSHVKFWKLNTPKRRNQSSWWRHGDLEKLLKRSRCFHVFRNYKWQKSSFLWRCILSWLFFHCLFIYS